MKRQGIIVKPSAGLGATFNPAAVKTAVANYILLVRSVPEGYRKTGPVNEFDDRYTSHLSLWHGSTPDRFKLIDPAVLKPDQPYDRYGVEDPRVTKIGQKYYICYTALAKGLGQADAGDGIRIAMASTTDFKTFTKHGIIGPDARSKAGTLFESQGKLHFLWKDEAGAERTMLSPTPADFENAAAWKDLWADKSVRHVELLPPQNNSYESRGTEPGAPPVEIEEGLLVVYSSISEDYKWSISLLLLDKQNPDRIIAKSNMPIMTPAAKYERNGDVPNVVFPCGALVDGDRLYIYYGAADTVCAVASESMSNIRKSLRPFQNHPAPALKQ